MDVDLHVHKRFRRSIASPSAFAEWALAHFNTPRPQILLPCHGNVADAADQGERLRALVRANFPPD